MSISVYIYAWLWKKKFGRVEYTYCNSGIKYVYFVSVKSCNPSMAAAEVGMLWGAYYSFFLLHLLLWLPPLHSYLRYLLGWGVNASCWSCVLSFMALFCCQLFASQKSEVHWRPFGFAFALGINDLQWAARSKWFSCSKFLLLLRNGVGEVRCSSGRYFGDFEIDPWQFQG